MRNYLTFAGTNLITYDLYINGRGTYNAPAKRYNLIKVPGRSGDLALDEDCFENIDIKYPSSFIFEDFDTNLKNLKAYLYSKSGYQRIEDTYHPDEFRMGIFKDALDVDADMYNRFGMFDLVFHCKPQRYLKSGESITTLLSSDSINNPTAFNSKPFFRVYGEGILGIGSQSITINEADGYTDIDCAMMEAFKGTVSKNDKVVLSDYKFPVLTPGVNNFSLGSGITKVEITPRWWTI